MRSTTLVSLHIRDFAIIDTLDVDFSAGFTVFSGETGAGKSILFDALGLILGDRAESGVVRTGAKRTEVSGQFDLSACPQAQLWLDEQGLSDEDDPALLLIRRQILDSGQSRGFINGSPAKLGQMRELSEFLIDIHGQHAHQSLLKPGQQRRLLDRYGKLEDEVAALSACYKNWQAIERKIEAIIHGGQDVTQRRELLRYQLQELDELQPDEQEFAQLEIDYRRQSEAENLLSLAGQSSNLLYEGDNSVYDLSQKAANQLIQLSQIDPRFEAALNLCEQAQINIKEAAALCEDLASDIDPDPAALHALSQRLDTYQNQARKHRIQPQALAAHWQAMQSELQSLESSEQDLQELQTQLVKVREQYQQHSQRLSKARQTAAKKLSAAITKTVRPLGLAHAECEVTVHWQADHAPQSHGQDKVELLVAMNPGQQAAPLAKVASGGELARTSLAIQVVCLNQSPVPVLLFDEVDVGIGGGIAETVGRQLKALANETSGYQVFCVTHQAQVAALADEHFSVSKKVQGGVTHTQIKALDQAGRVEELARMIGGMKITQQTQAHAQEMLNLAAQVT